MYDDFVTLLTASHYRLTKPRTVVFMLLQDASTPLTIVEIAKQLRGIDKVSVYRTITLFKELGIISVVTNGWSHKYELASPMKPHHHHLVCSSCHNVIEIKSNELESIIDTVTTSNNFQATSHHFEIIGLCQGCH